MNIAIFGAGNFGKRLASYIHIYTNNRIVGFIDNNKDLYGKIVNLGEGIPIYSLEQIADLNIDRIIISTKSKKVTDGIKEQLRNIDIYVEAMIENHELYMNVMSYTIGYDKNNDRRVGFLKDFSRYVHDEKLKGDVAECGVNWGDFSYYMNEYFPDKKLYLFDTFEGFDERDLNIEFSLKNSDFVNGEFAQEESHFRDEIDKVEVIKRKMPYIEKCEIRKGYFPESAEGLECTFCFVNLDMDLYAPMLAALYFFYDKMCTNGIILLHDYYHPDLPGVKKAVADFEKAKADRIIKTPIGDGGSIAIIKT